MAALPTLAVLTGAYLLSQFFRTALAVVAPEIARDLALDPARLGVLSSAWFWAFATAQIPIGVALDRWGPRLTVSVLFGVAGLGCVAFARADGLASAAFGQVLIGIGCGPVLHGGAGGARPLLRSAPVRAAVLDPARGRQRRHAAGGHALGDGCRRIRLAWRLLRHGRNRRPGGRVAGAGRPGPTAGHGSACRWRECGRGAVGGFWPCCAGASCGRSYRSRSPATPCWSRCAACGPAPTSPMCSGSGRWSGAMPCSSCPSP